MTEEKIKYRGVDYEKNKKGTKKWRVRVTFEGKIHFGGRFNTQEEAINQHKKIYKRLITEPTTPII